MTSRGSQQSEYNYVQEKVYEQIRKTPVNYTVTDFQKMKSQKRIKNMRKSDLQSHRQCVSLKKIINSKLKA